MSSHYTRTGEAIMADLSGKEETRRTAVAEGYLLASASVLAAITDNALPKGDALAVARVAGILAVKNTPRAIPLCHPIPLDGCEIAFAAEPGRIRARCQVACRARTGAEMEALSGVTTALLTLYDMAKSLDKGMEIGGVRLLEKSGGKSGDYRRPADGP